MYENRSNFFLCMQLARVVVLLNEAQRDVRLKHIEKMAFDLLHVVVKMTETFYENQSTKIAHIQYIYALFFG